MWWYRVVFVTVQSSFRGNVEERGLEWTEGGRTEERTALSGISLCLCTVCVGVGLHNALANHRNNKVR